MQNCTQNLSRFSHGHAHWRAWLFALLLVIVAGCTPPAEPSGSRIRVVADGQSLTLSTEQPLTVGQLLDRNNIQLGPLDRIDPAVFTLVTDGLNVTIVRVREDRLCEREAIAYKTQELPRPEIAAGDRKVVQAGITGEAQVCFAVRFEDNVEKTRNQVSATTIKQPQDQLVAIGIDLSKIEPVDIPGILIYRSAGQAYFLEGSSNTQGTLNTGGNLDGRVFALSQDGNYLLYTRGVVAAEATPEAGAATAQCSLANELWILPNLTDPAAKPMKINSVFNVLTATWVPGQPLVFSYSTFNPRPDSPCYQALNDLILARIDAEGKLVNAKPVVTSKPLGAYSGWGTTFAWSPDGNFLAWGQVDGGGLVDLKKGEFVRLVSFPVYTTTLTRGWLWKPTPAWSHDANILALTVHGPPVGDEQPETSPTFDIALVQALGTYFINPAVAQAGMWSSPKFSTLIRVGETVQGSQAYLKARKPVDSVSSDYDLVIADRDGSNPRIVFPEPDREGVKPLEGGEFTWSPDGRQLAVIYQGDVYIIDAVSGRATRVTLLGNSAALGTALQPQWAPR